MPSDVRRPSDAAPRSSSGSHPLSLAVGPARVAREPRRLFEPLGATYERAGSLLSLGFERGWRRRLVHRAAPRDGDLYLDVATGTGLVARELRTRAGCRVVGLDLTPGMLAAADRNDGIRYVLGRAERLPFSDATFDGLTFTYLLRYVDDPAATLRELVRVVRPGGRIAMLEFARPRSLPLRIGWWLYTRLALPLLGALVSRDWRSVGAFLGRSIDQFYDRHDLTDVEAMWRAAGIEEVMTERLGMGTAIVTSGIARDRAKPGHEVESAGSTSGAVDRREERPPSARAAARSREGGDLARGRGGPGAEQDAHRTTGAPGRATEARDAPDRGNVAAARAGSRTTEATSDPPERRSTAPAFYALRSGGWRDYVTLLHPPYTLWHLSYVVLGAALASEVRLDRLAGTLLAFFLALGVGVHALDELNGRPLRTRILDGVLRALAIGGVGSAVALGLVATPLVGPGLLVFIAAGVALALGYPLELARGRLHSDLWFALGWGAFPVLTGAFASGGSITAAAIAGSGYALALSYAQRRLSTWVRMLRRRAESVSGEIRSRDGERTPIDRERLMAAPESALRWLTLVAVLVAVAALAVRLL